MLTLLDLVKQDYRHIDFEPGTHFMWQPSTSTISYDPESISDSDGMWSLFHEVAHASLDHTSYRDDLELLMMEVSAWSKAKEIAARYQITIDEKHIQKCVESYREWLHKRSRCIDCQTNSLQADRTTYACHNCGTSWKVSESKLSKIRKTRVMK